MNLCIVLSAIENHLLIWSDDHITDRFHEYIIHTTDVYKEELNLNEQAANQHCDLMQAFGDLANLNIDHQRSFETSQQESTHRNYCQ